LCGTGTLAGVFVWLLLLVAHFPDIGDFGQEPVVTDGGLDFFGYGRICSKQMEKGPSFPAASRNE
jgi:hypothetical protein